MKKLGSKLLKLLNKITLILFYPLISVIEKHFFCEFEKRLKNKESKFDFMNNNMESFYRLLVQNNLIISDNENKINKFAVFGVMPPLESGISDYNFLLFGNKLNVDVFTNPRNQIEYSKLKNLNLSNTYLVKDYNVMQLIYSYKKTIYVLGNSDHNLEILEHLIFNSENQENNFLYLHEIVLNYVIFKFADKNTFVFIKLLRQYFNIKEMDIKKISHYLYSNKFSKFDKIFTKIVKNSTLFILKITKIKNIIVSNQFAQKILLNDIKNTEFENKVKIHIIDLPIQIYKNCESFNYKHGKEFILGTFGYPNDENKMTNKIIEATHILNEKNVSCKCILAGYEINNYAKNVNESYKKNCIFIDSPSITDFIKIENSIDLAIQLRKKSTGETSGCIPQLLGLNKKIITNTNFISDNYKKYSYLFNIEETSEELANTIVKVMNSPNKINMDEIKEKYTFDKALEKIEGLIIQ